MRTLDRTDPKRFIAAFFTAFTDEMLSGDEEPAAIVDRYHTPDIVQIADGHRIDRNRLIAHTRQVRKSRPDSRIEVHEAVANGDHVAARYTVHVRRPKRDVHIDVHFFGHFAADGRLREADMLTRTVPADPDQPAAGRRDSERVTA